MTKIFGGWLDTTQKKIIFGGMICFLLVGLIPPLMSYDSPHSSRAYGIIFLDGGSPYGGGYVGGIGHYESVDLPFNC